MFDQYELNFSAQILDGGQAGPIFRIRTITTQATEKNQSLENMAEGLVDSDAKGTENWISFGAEFNESQETGKEMEDLEERKSCDIIAIKKEENFEELENMSRVVPAQLEYITFKSGSRYHPVKKNISGGIICLVDATPEIEKELIKKCLRYG